MTDEHLEIAYWYVLKDLEPGSDIPMARLSASLPEFLSATGTSSGAGEVLSRALLGIGWNWPAWVGFAQKVGYDSLPEIEVEIARMRPMDILKLLRLSELQALCRDRSLPAPSRTTKPVLIAAFLKAVPDSEVSEILSTFRLRLKTQRDVKCRERMATHLATRIFNVAQNMHRYEQLNDPQLSSLRPNWRFVWGGTTDIETPKACRKFNNKKLPHAQAKEVFPALPCSYLHCGCYIVADGSPKR